ncbi:hypothetical protein [Emcibacter sp. SYSU 3D8]|uniref:hypothetical protein n=1 Tax=Emcibacter sp. SYSU 3D8 TaxID=3133969 RepID=UPI0031FED6CB
MNFFEYLHDEATMKLTRSASRGKNAHAAAPDFSAEIARRLLAFCPISGPDACFLHKVANGARLSPTGHDRLIDAVWRIECGGQA